VRVVRLIHTGDWHLGQTLGGFSRDPEHKRFLAWLLDRIDEERADALLVCGDVFDTGNAPSSAQALYYGFLADLRRRFAELDVVVIGGNHDAAPRLDAPGPILRSLRMHVVGALPRGAEGEVDVESCAVPLVDKRGHPQAWCAAVPFLRMPDLVPQPADVADPVVAGVRDAYRRVLDGVRAKAARDRVPIIALGHCHMQGASLTDDSERPVFGNVHPLPADIFPDDVAYAALGHLHFAQSVGGRESVRYSGSPIPLSMTERPYKHRVLVVDVDHGSLAVRALPIPRSVDLLRVPEKALDVKEALEALRLLDVPARPLEERPFLEVRVKLDAPCPDLRTRIEGALEGKDVRLVRVHRELAGDGTALADAPEAAAASSLAEIEPAVVLARLYERTYGGAVPADIRAAFDELLESVTPAAAAAAVAVTRPP
jgi:exonuclease SbcD